MSNTARIAATAANTLTKPLNVEEVFSTYLLDGSGTITNGIDLAGEGGLLWTKWRSGGALSFYQNHFLYDTERGYGSTDYLHSNNTDAAGATGAIGSGSFNSDGFTTGGNVFSGNEWASWTFRKAPKFFDVVTYTGDGTLRNIPHNLGSVPGTIIVKRTDGAGNWYVQHRSTGPTKSLFLDTTTAATTRPEWGNTAPTDSVFTVDGTTVTATNYNGFNYVAYLFAHNDGDGDFGPTGDQDIIKCGSWTASQPSTVTLGFEPQWLLVKRTDGVSNWFLVDNMRGADFSAYKNLSPDLSNAEGTQAGETFTFNPDGFTYNGSVVGGNNTCIYIAIRRGPMAVPESATDVFAVDQGDTTSTPAFNSGFVTDFNFYRNVSSASDFFTSSRLTGNKYLATNSAAAESSSSSFTWDFMDGFREGTLGTTFYSWMWRRAPNYFDVVAGTGTSTLDAVSHNLGVTPELIIQKKRSGSSSMDWFVTGSGVGGTNKYLILNSTAAVATTVTLAHDASTFTPIFDQDDYIAYLFASLPGISKVGSYTGNGTSQTIDCGFSSGARFVLIKRTDAGGNWLVVDTERGLVSGNDPVLLLDATNAEQTNLDIVDPTSSGFIVNGTSANWNASGGSYIFYAIA